MRYRVLIADDEPASARLLRRLVERLQHDVIALASTTTEAVEMCRLDRPDIVLMDVTFKSSELQGPEAALILYEQFNLPVIFVSAIDDERLYRIVVEAKAYGYIVKPPEPHQLRLSLELSYHRNSLEHKLRSSEAQFAAALRSSLDAVVTINAEGNVVEFNPAAESIFGWRRAEVLGRSMPHIIIPPKYRNAHAEGMARYFATGEGPVLGRRIEIEAMRRDGEVFPVELAINPFIVNGQAYFTAYVRDITDRKTVEQSIKQRDRLLSGAARATDALLQSHDFDTAIHGALGILGETIDADNIMALGELDFAKPASYARIDCSWQAHGTSTPCPPAEVPAEILTLINTHRETLLKGEPLETGGVAADSDQSEYLSCLSLMLLPFGINDSFTGLLIIGFGDRIKSWAAGESEVLQSLAGSIGGAFARRKTLEELQESRRSLQEKVTALKQREEELRQTTALLVRREKLANLGSIAGMIAHEINSPLGAIINSAERLQADDLDAATRKRNLNLILKAGMRCKSVVGKFLLSVRPSAEKNICRLGVVLEDWFELYGKHFEHLGIEVRAHRSGDCTIGLDYTECSQILTNLMFNARDALLDAGIKQPLVEIFIACDVGHGRIEIRDNGPGFANSILTSALDPFVTSKGEGKGTGLGLFIVQNIVAGAGGSLQYGNYKGGAQVEILIPIADAQDASGGVE